MLCHEEPGVKEESIFNNERTQARFSALRWYESDEPQGNRGKMEGVRWIRNRDEEVC
jgi:hypothetical protein